MYPRDRFPRLYAAASLKRSDVSHSATIAASCAGFSAALCRGLIEATSASADHRRPSTQPFSAALCRGLIEALPLPSRVNDPGLRERFPRLYAAASLKPTLGRCWWGLGHWFSAALCRGLIEATPRRRRFARGTVRFPRLYAAASLKRARMQHGLPAGEVFSAALCRGLIEASSR